MTTEPLHRLSFFDLHTLRNSLHRETREKQSLLSKVDHEIKRRKKSAGRCPGLTAPSQDLETSDEA